MNKRQKKKKEKKEAWDAEVLRLYDAWNGKVQSEHSLMSRNSEGYSDPTAFKALMNCIKKGY